MDPECNVKECSFKSLRASWKDHPEKTEDRQKDK